MIYYNPTLLLEIKYKNIYPFLLKLICEYTEIQCNDHSSCSNILEHIFTRIPIRNLASASHIFKDEYIYRKHLITAAWNELNKS